MKKLTLFIFLALSLYASDPRSKIDHIIVVYLENRSFDNLFRGFEGADTSAKPFKPYALQSDSNGTVYRSLPMGEEAIKLGLPRAIDNKPFLLDTYISQTAIIPDMVHRFFQNQQQINSGKNDRFVAHSDEKALSMGYHNIQNSALWKYADEFTLCDRFFAGAFGG